MDAWVPVATLVLGYVGSLATEWIRDRRMAEQKRRARREDFERDALVELQQTLFDFIRSAGEAGHLDLMNFRKTGQWGHSLLPTELDERFFKLGQRVGVLRERIFDKELRDLVDDVKKHAVAASLARSESQSDAELVAMGDTFEKANRRLGELLRALY